MSNESEIRELLERTIQSDIVRDNLHLNIDSFNLERSFFNHSCGIHLKTTPNKDILFEDKFFYDAHYGGYSMANQECSLIFAAKDLNEKEKNIPQLEKRLSILYKKIPEGERENINEMSEVLSQFLEDNKDSGEISPIMLAYKSCLSNFSLGVVPNGLHLTSDIELRRVRGSITDFLGGMEHSPIPISDNLTSEQAAKYLNDRGFDKNKLGDTLKI